MKISILLPSLREELALHKIREFATTNKDADYEIVVVSPFKVDEDRVKWVYEEKPVGVINAQNVAFENSTGEYVIGWSDDCSPTPNCLSKMLHFVEGEESPFMGAYKLNGGYWLVPPVYVVYVAYGKVYANFGCASRDTFDIIGGYLDPIYKGFWADVDMSLRVWDKNGRVGVCPDTWVDLHNDQGGISKENQQRNFNGDMKTFLDRWHNKLGQGIELSEVEKDWQTINYGILVG